MAETDNREHIAPSSMKDQPLVDMSWDGKPPVIGNGWDWGVLGLLILNDSYAMDHSLITKAPVRSFQW